MLHDVIIVLQFIHMAAAIEHRVHRRTERGVNARKVISQAQQLSCILGLVARIEIRIPERRMHRLRDAPGARHLAVLRALDLQRADDVGASLDIGVAAGDKVVELLVDILLAAGHQQAIGALHTLLGGAQALAGILDGRQTRAAKLHAVGDEDTVRTRLCHDADAVVRLQRAAEALVGIDEQWHLHAVNAVHPLDGTGHARVILRGHEVQIRIAALGAGEIAAGNHNHLEAGHRCSACGNAVENLGNIVELVLLHVFAQGLLVSHTSFSLHDSNFFCSFSLTFQTCMIQ